MRLLGAIFTGTGALFLAVGLVLLARDLSFFAGTVRTEGEVVAIRVSARGRTGAPDVAYTDDIGRAHVFRSNTYSRPSYEVGDVLTIAFHPADPERAAIDSPSQRWLIPGIFTLIGGIQLAVGLFVLIRRARRKRLFTALLRDGQRVLATSFKAVQDTRIRVNGQHPWVLHCQATLPGESAPRHFKNSRRFWYDPTSALGPTVAIRYDPHDPTRHAIDTGDLPSRR